MKNTLQSALGNGGAKVPCVHALFAEASAITTNSATNLRGELIRCVVIEGGFCDE